MIELKRVGRVFRTSEVETIALENVNISVEQGEFVAVMGPSGCGKSTLLNIMGLLDRPTEGEVILKGTPTGSLSDRQAAAFRNKTVGFVFQSFHLIPSLNVQQNVEMPLLYCGMSEGKRHERRARRMCRGSSTASRQPIPCDSDMEPLTDDTAFAILYLI